MIISEKQIQQLLYFTQEYRHMLLGFGSMSQLTKDGENELEIINKIITSIINQQSQELTDVSDER